MPINESSARMSNLSEKQQQEASRALFGEPAAPNDLSFEERKRMRAILDQADAQENRGLGEFDLNRPPQPPYVYREYPFVVYKHTRPPQSRLARNYEERERLKAEGWSEQAPLCSRSDEPAPREIELTAAEQAEADEIQEKLKKRKA